MIQISICDMIDLYRSDECVTPRVSVPSAMEWNGMEWYGMSSMKVTERRTNESEMLNTDWFRLI